MAVVLPIGLIDAIIFRSQRHQDALAKLSRTARRHLPKAKGDEFMRAYKKQSLTASRKAKKDAVRERDDPNSVQTLNIDILQRIMAHLRPPDLARAMCVSTDWAEAACSDLLWSRFANQFSSADASEVKLKLDVQAELQGIGFRSITLSVS